MDFIEFKDFKEELDCPDDAHKVDKLKESFLLLKKKMCRSHDLIQQYNDKLKECERIKSELDRARDEADKTKRNYNATLAKVIKLELQNTEYKKNAEVMTKRIAECETRIAGDQRHVQQLICKVEDIEDKHSEKVMQCELKKADLEVKVKELEQELKATKKSHKTELKKMEKKSLHVEKSELKENSHLETKVKSVQDAAVNTVIDFNELMSRPVTLEKSTLTDEFYSFKDDPYPLFCAKCDFKIPISFEKLYEVTKCQPLLTEVLSPLPPSISETSNVTEVDKPKPIVTDSLRVSDIENRSTIHVDTVGRNTSLRALQKKIKALERKMKKKLKNNRVQSNCCTHQQSHNCYSVVPSQSPLQPDLMFKFWERMLEFNSQQQQQSIHSRKRKREETFKKPHRNKTVLKKKRKVENIVSNWAVETVIPNIEEELFIDNSDSIDHPNLHLKDKSTFLPIDRSRNNFYYDENSHRTLSDNKQQKHKSDYVPFQKTQSEKDYASVSTSVSDSSDVKSCTSEESMKYIRPSLSPDTLRSSSIEQQITLQPSDHESDTISSESINVKNIESSRKCSKALRNSQKRTTRKTLLTKLRNLKKTSNKCHVLRTTSDDYDVQKSTESNVVCENIQKKKVTCSNKNLETSASNLNVSDDSYVPTRRQRIAHIPQTNTPQTDKPQIKDLQRISSCENQGDDAEAKDRSNTDECILNAETTYNSCDKIAIESTNGIEDSTKEHVEQLQCMNNLKNPVEITKTVDKAEIFEETEQIEINDEMKRSNIENCVSGQDRDSITCLSTQLENTENDNSFDLCTSEDNVPIENDSVSNFISESNLLPSVDSPSIMPELSSTSMANSNNIISSLNESKFKEDDCKQDKDCAEVDSELSRATNNPIFHNRETNDKCSPKKVVAVDTVSRNLRSRITMDETMNSVKELRSRQIILSSKISSDKVVVNREVEEIEIDKTTMIEPTCSNDISEMREESFSPTSLLVQHIGVLRQGNKRVSKFRKKTIAKFRCEKENFIRTQLDRLVTSDTWMSTLHQDVAEQLSKFPKLHTMLAKCIVDFLCEKAEDNEPLDKSYTPPAPLMTKTQQRITALLVTLDLNMPTIFQLVQSGIEYRLFRLGHAPEVEIIDGLVRIFTALARIKKDRERVRILCCDALYCLGLKAISLIYIVFTCWPEVFPMAGSSQEALPKCITHLIMTQTAIGTFPKLFALKNLLSSYYKYSSSGYLSSNLAIEFMHALREKRYNGLDTAIILLAKREDTNWAYKNIVQGGLLQMIISNSHPSIYEAFCLLGNILRSFPVNDENGVVKNIVQQLCDLIDSGKVSEEQQEGIVSALLSLSRHEFNEVARFVMKWKPSKPLRPLTLNKLKTFFSSHPPIYWNKFMQRNCSITAKCKT